MDKNELYDLIPAYALGALDPDEHAEVEALLATDAEARRLLAGYQAVTDQLVLSVPARPAPTHLQDDLRQRLAARPAPQSAASLQRPQLNRRRKITPWLPLVAVAAVIALVFGAATLLLQRSPAEQLYNQITAQTGYITLLVAPSEAVAASGEMVVGSDFTRGVIRVSNLPTITTDQTFQLWLIDSDGAHSAGLFRVDDPQTANYIVVQMPKPYNEYAAFGVSIEPQGGSPNPDGPSTPPIFAVPVNA